MRVVLVGPDLEEDLSLRFLVASLRAAGHEARIATFDTDQDAEMVLASAATADLVGLSMCYQIRAPEFLALARALKQARPERPVIKLLEGTKVCLQAVLDNYSRKILAWTVMERFDASNTCQVLLAAASIS